MRVKTIGCFILFLGALSGCTTEYNLATQKEEMLLYGTEKEVRIGESIAAKIDSKYADKIMTEVDVNERLQRILDRIVAVCDRQDIVYFIKAIDDEPMNAVSLPGGYIYVFKGLLDHVENDAQLAGVIAHEVGHIAAKHGIKRAQNSYGALLLQVLSGQVGNGRVSQGVNLALGSLFSEYSQQDEYESDRLSIKYLKKAGYDPAEIVGFLRKLKEEQEKAPLRPFSYWRTHPHISKRIAVANQELTGELEFKDYLNLMGD